MAKIYRKAAPPLTTASTEVKRQIAKSPHFASIYTNDVQLQTSPWDVRLIFGEIAEPASPVNPTVIINLLGEVRMSPQLAKRVVAAMLEQLQAYEARFGQIPVDTDPSSSPT